MFLEHWRQYSKGLLVREAIVAMSGNKFVFFEIVAFVSDNILVGKEELLNISHMNRGIC